MPYPAPCGSGAGTFVIEGTANGAILGLAPTRAIWTSDFWQNLQRRPAEKGFYSGTIDGRAKSATLDAARRLGKS